MKLFIIGPTGSGKTTLAQRLANHPEVEFEMPVVVSAGAWIRKELNCYGHTPEDTQRLTYESYLRLKENPLMALSYLKKATETCRPCIVEGIRNPTDLLGLIEFDRDIVVYIDGAASATDWEESGLASILSIVDAAGHLLGDRYVRLQVDTLNNDWNTLNNDWNTLNNDWISSGVVDRIIHLWLDSY